jgi:hypothetical protein
MFGDGFSNKIRITIIKTGESIELDQRRVKIRENQNGLMALSYVAPVFKAMDMENFFGEALSSEKLSMDIGDTGEFRVSFRGIIEGNEKNFPQNMDHKIILLQEPTCLDSRMNVKTTGVSKFKLRKPCSQ